MDNLVYTYINLTGIICVSAAFWITYTRNSLSIIHTLLFSIGWGASIGLNQFLLGGSIRVLPETLLLLYGVWVVFFMGVILGQSVSISHNVTETPILKNNSICILLFLIIAHISIKISELNSIGAFSSIDPSQILTSLAMMRVKQEFADADIAWYTQFFRSGFVLYIPLAIVMYKNKFIGKSSIVFVLLIATILSLSNFTRAPILNVIISTWVSLLLIHSGRVEYMLFRGTLVLLLSVGFFIFMESTISFVAQVENESIIGLIAPYFGGPVKAYETILLNGQSFSDQGFYSFDMINYIFKKIGIISEYPDLVREYVYLPFPTNMYTFLDVYTLDFGIFGAFVGTFVTGFVIASVQKYALKGSYLAITVYALLMYYLVMTPFNNEFIRFNFIMYLVLAWLINIAITKRIEFIGYPLSKNLPAVLTNKII
ncbi:MAG: oligosaccharide repeat unit polymerase [Desulfuromonadales bacterium]|nr:oligosaccharide repeat unit polymerase [Desulfuromonadales bacterium]